MGLVAIGPVAISHGNPQFGTAAAPTTHGIESVSISGSCSWSAVHTLRELVNNPAAQTTIGGYTGVLEWLEYDDDLLEPLTGYYLLERFNLDADQQDSLATTDAPFTIQAAFLGDMA